MQKYELLAPAGDLDAGYAALYYGADAVYLGLKSFSARASATNFSPEELDTFTAYAHHLKRKVYVTVNTLVQEAELSDLIKTLDICAACQVDGIILQDLGVAEIIKKHYPTLAMHASTQMAVHNYEGALALKKLGFTRVVLARELSLNEIQKIATIPDLEIEVFIHGALCYAYSGLCLFSSMETGRSANRGKCAYPCRSLFQRGEKSQHCFSMKDLALGENILKLPVCSLKIEGRKKKDLYVAAVVNYYRHILDSGIADPIGAEDIHQIFSRPWTTFHFLGKNRDIIDPDFVGHRGLVIGRVENVIKQQLTFIPKHKLARYDGLQIDIPGIEKPFGFSVQQMTFNGHNIFEAKSGQKVQITLPPHSPFIPKGAIIYLASSSQVKGKYTYSKPSIKEYKNRPEIPVSVTICPTQISAQANGQTVTELGPFNKAENPTKMQQAIIDTFNKYKDTPFKPVLSVHNPDHLFVPMSLLNSVRRKLYQQISISVPTVTLDTLSPCAHQNPRWLIKTDQPDSILGLDLSDFDEILIVLNPALDLQKLKQLPKNRVRLALPTIARHTESLIPVIQNLLNQGYHKWEIGNVWGLSILPTKGIDLTFDSSLYAMNTRAIKMAQNMGAGRITLSMEDTLANLETVVQKSPLPTVMVVYQDIPLFISANCIKNNCEHCQKQECVLPLVKQGEKYGAKIQNCQLTLISQKPFYAATFKDKIRADFYRIDLVNKHYTPDEAGRLIKQIRAGENIPQTHTGNLKRII